MMKDKLWTRSFLAVAGGNFLLFFAFYLLLPVLPMYLMEQFGSNKATVGVILSSYTITALFVRPFAGYMVDTFPRKPLQLICYGIFTLFFGGYLLAGTLLLFAVIRAMHGLAFGMVTVSNSTVAIDVMPSSRRGEGIGYYGVSSNLAMAMGPTVSLYILDAFRNYDSIFLLSLFSCILGFFLVTTIKMPLKQRSVEIQPEKEHVSLDRFLLVKGVSGAISLCLLSFSYGVLSTYLAIYGKEEVGIDSGTGLYFMLMAFGLIFSRLTTGKYLNKGLIVNMITVGIVFLVIGYSVFIFLKSPVEYYFSAAVLGMGYGLICPSFQNLFINLATHSQRGTANSTFFTAWDLGLGLGVLIGGSIADMSDYTAAYTFALVLVVLGFFFFRHIAGPYFEKNKLR